MKKLLLFLFSVIVLPAFSQNCAYYPNTPDMIWNNSVSKQTITTEDRNTGRRYISDVLFFDTTGNCYKHVYLRRYGNSETYQFNEWSSPYDVKKRWDAFGYYDKDSNEVISNRNTYYLDEYGNTVKEESCYRADSAYVFNVVMYEYDSAGHTFPGTVYRLNEKGDTLEKAFSVKKDYTTTHITLVKNKKKWIEKEKTISETDKSGYPLRNERYEYGKCVENRTWTYVFFGGVEQEVSEYSFGQLVEKIGYFNGGYTVTTYENGKVINTWSEYYPIADPVPDEYLPQDTTFSNKVVAVTRHKIQPPPPPQRNPKPSMAPRIEKKYRNDNPANELLMTQEFGTDGLIRKQEVVWDNKIYYWSYEFYSAK